MTLLLKQCLVFWGAVVHRFLKITAFNANGVGRQAYKLRKQMEVLKIVVTLFTDTRLKTHTRFYIPNYPIYRTDRQDRHKGGTTGVVKKGIRRTYVDLTSFQ